MRSNQDRSGTSDSWSLHAYLVLKEPGFVLPPSLPTGASARGSLTSSSEGYGTFVA